MLAMKVRRDFISYFLFFLFAFSTAHLPGTSSAQTPSSISAQEKSDTAENEETDYLEETALHSDRFIFRGQDVDELFMVLMTFERGIDHGRIFGEFLGLIFEKNQLAFLEGSAKYPYQSQDFKNIFPSYHTKIEGSSESGFKLSYDGGDATFNISSGPVLPLYQPDNSETIQKIIGVAEAVATIHGKEYWGDLVHESLVWKGFNALTRHEGIYKDYQAFYLKSEKGKQIYLHQNKADQEAFLKKYPLPETLQAEGGVILENQETIHTFKAPIPITWLKEKRSPLGFYTVPEQFRIDTSESLGSLFVWPRDAASKNWFYGGYYIMAIEGLLKGGEEEERVWGFAEYFH